MSGIFDASGNVLVFLAVLLLLVVWHELGHFVTAKLNGVTVLEFGVGYPPKLFGKMFRGTEYTVNMLPLGGFVRMVGEEDPTEKGSLASKGILPRIIVLSAGSAMNAILPVILLTAAFMIPKQVALQPVVVGAVAAESPAGRQGVQPGDQILRINERDIRSQQDLAYNLQLNAGSIVQLTLKSGDSQRFADVPIEFPGTLEGSGISFTGTVLIQAVAPGSPAADAGMQPGDQIVRVGNEPVASTRDVQVATAKQAGAPVSFELQREDQPITVTVTPRRDPPPGQGATGITIAAASPTPPQIVTESLPLFEAVGSAARRSADYLTLFRNGIYSMFVSQTKSSGPAVTGPIGIAQATGEVAKAGLLPLLEWTALLSMNLAIMNILPIPMLDGGRVLFVVIEWLRRGRRISPQREGFVHALGFAALMTLIAVVSFFDIQRILGGGGVIR
jgi:regulator of sigma E protease